MKTALMFGAGNVGRGFLGQLFHESGYEVIFVDIDQILIDALNASRSYPLLLVDNENRQELTISPVRGILASAVEEISHTIAIADIAATAVGARALTSIAPLIANGIEKRAEYHSLPLNIIICENLKDAAASFRSMVATNVTPPYQNYFTQSVGFVDTVIGRMVPPPTPEMRVLDPRLILVEPYKELPVDSRGFVGSPPEIVGMIPSENFSTFTARKLYIHNCGHAVLAYMGFLKGFQYGYEALTDPEIFTFLNNAWDESQAGIISHYAAPQEWLNNHRQDLLYRFKNRALGDTIVRLGRDPIRKLAANDRLVAPARMAENAGVQPLFLAKAIAAAYSFSTPEDPLSQQLQQDIASQGIEPVLLRISGISPHERLGELILAEYHRLQAGKVL